MAIRVWPSKIRATFDGAECMPLEVHEIREPVSIEQWLRLMIPSFELREAPPISVHVNGALIDPTLWGTTLVQIDDSIDIYPEPKGAAFVAFIVTYGAYILAGIALIYALTLPRPSAPKNQSQAQGRELEEASAKGNKVKINAAIREVSGLRKIYPDYLLPPHRFFENERQQTVRLLLCIGKGEFDIDQQQVLIGDSPMIGLDENATFTIYGPDESMAGDPCAEWWHVATEVGPTSTGSPGIRLTTSTAGTSVAQAVTYIFSGDTITIPAGAGQFPLDWDVDMVLVIQVEYPFVVLSGGTGRDIIQGDLSGLSPTIGMLIDIAGDNAGRYEVVSYTPDSSGNDEMTLDYAEFGTGPASDLTLGAVSMSIAAAGQKWRIAAIDSSYTEIQVERLIEGVVDPSWPGFVDITSTTASLSIDQTLILGDWSGPFAACPASETTDSLEYDLMFPVGLVDISKEGKLYTASVTVELQYRDIDAGGDWTSVITEYSAATLDQLGYTEVINLPAAIRPEVRVRRIGAESSSTRKQDQAQWYGLRALLPIKTAYEGVTTISIEVKGGNNVAAESERQISVIATRLLPLRTGTSWSVPTATRDIAPWIAYVAKSIGYTDDDIDFDELDRLHAIWTARGDYLDMAVEAPSTAKAILNSSLRAGFAEFTVDRGRLRPVRDEPRTAYEQMYTPQNMTEPLVRQFLMAALDDYDGVDVEYVSDQSWAVETVQCRLPGDIGRKVEKITIDGVTDRTRAWRIGMRQRRANRYRRKQYRFATELDALNSRYLSYCALADDVPGYAQSAILRSYGSGIIESSEPLDWSASGTHVVALRRKDGTLSGPYTATRIDDYRLSISGLDFTPDVSWETEPPHILFGPLNRWNYPVLITAISPSGNDSVSVEAVNYDARVYDDDDNSPS